MTMKEHLIKVLQDLIILIKQNKISDDIQKELLDFILYDKTSPDNQEIMKYLLLGMHVDNLYQSTNTDSINVSNNV